MIEKATNNLTCEELARSAIATWWHAGGAAGTEPVLDSLSEDDRMAWLETVSLAIQIVDLPRNEVATREVSARASAKLLYERFNFCLHQEEPPDWDGVDLKTRLRWEAVFRHLANWIDADEGVDLAGTEPRWLAWVESRALVTA